MDCVGLWCLVWNRIRLPFSGDIFRPALVDDILGLGSAAPNRATQAGSVSKPAAVRFRGNLRGVRTRGSLART